MTARRRLRSAILLFFCVLILCFCGGCLDGSGPVPEAEDLSGPSVSIEAATEGYGLMMSTTVGIRMQPVVEGTIAGNTSYAWQCDGGQFLIWGAPDYTVTEHGSSLLLHQPECVYWSPMGPGWVVPEGDELSPVIVTLDVLGDDGAFITEATPVTIETRDDGLWYAE